MINNIQTETFYYEKVEKNLKSRIIFRIDPKTILGVDKRWICSWDKESKSVEVDQIFYQKHFL